MIPFLEEKEVNLLIENSNIEEINIPDHKGNTPLFWAINEENVNIVQLLIDVGAFVNQQNYFGETPLYLAAARGNYEICLCLMNHGSELNVGNLEGTTPLHIACANGYKEIVKLLIKYGAFVNVQDEEGDTPLHYAIREDKNEIVEILIKEFNADLTICNNDYENPLQLALSINCDSNIIEFLTLQKNMNEIKKEPCWIASSNIYKTLNNCKYCKNKKMIFV